MPHQDDIERMLSTIEQELALTRHLTDRAQLSPAVMEALATTPRHLFVPEEVKSFAYQNGPLPIGYGQTISQPFIVALMTDLLQITRGATILEIGTGCGYQTAVLARLAKQVYTIELVRELGKETFARLNSMGYDNVEGRIGDGYEGWPEHAPYDGIIVTAAAPEVPDALVEQLKPGARLVIPVGPPHLPQELQVITREEEGRVRRQPVLSVAFVPLLHERSDG